MRLLDTLRPELANQISGVLAERLLAIDNHDFSSVKRQVRDEMAKRGVKVDDDWLERGVYALKQYYALSIIDARNMHSISDVIDPFWHAHILNSEQYMEFCGTVMGRYLHHYPVDHANSQDVDFLEQVYKYTMGRYEQCFTVVDDIFHKKTPSREEHLCTHNADTDAAFAMFPIAAEAQPRTTAH